MSYIDFYDVFLRRFRLENAQCMEICQKLKHRSTYNDEFNETGIADMQQFWILMFNRNQVTPFFITRTGKGNDTTTCVSKLSIVKPNGTRQWITLDKYQRLVVDFFIIGQPPPLTSGLMNVVFRIVP